MLFNNKAKKQREIVESKLYLIDQLLKNAEDERLTDVIYTYTAKKVLLKEILHNFDRI